MEADLTSVEVVFAQKLACGEPITRQRAFRTLQDWIEQQSATNPFTEADMLRLCKGLHYVLWMQGKMLLQEELADRISQLLLVFSNEEERVLFIQSTFKSLAKEWNHIDRWRMDKFLMMMRRVLHVLFKHLSSLKWKKSIRNQYWNAFCRTTMSPDRSFPDGLKFHFASLILDELDNAGGINKKQVTACLKPFADLLAVRSISDYLFDSITEEIFATILHQKSEEVASRMENDGAGEDSAPGIEFDYVAIGQMLFDVGKKPETISRRRKKLYDLVKKFDVAAKDGDPYRFEAPVPEIVSLCLRIILDGRADLCRTRQLTARDYKEAEEKLRKLDEEVVVERKRMKLEKKCKQSPATICNNSGDEENAGNAVIGSVIKPKKSLNKKKAKTSKLGLKIKRRSSAGVKIKKLKSHKVNSGEKERAKEVLLARLRKDGWVTEVKAMARRMIKERGVDNVNLEMLYEELKQPARRLVSEDAKKELYLIVRDWVAQRCDVEL
ncbi:nucleolar protein,Nop52 [Ancylostoma caninum]|uniref:Transcription and mRNA export factor ENY2 n=1 Tax=Ancylostoma caninum TaxID=29170 RepID=A0A368H4Q4_ANCCA|nr:nucleolar protein,Nop52 [Ancylostoma caninum]